jgi:cell division protein FtsB
VKKKHKKAFHALEKRVTKLESLIIDPSSGQYISEAARAKRSEENDDQIRSSSGN